MTLHIQDDMVSQVKGSLTLLTHESIFHRHLSEIPNGTFIMGHVQWTCSLTLTPTCYPQVSHILQPIKLVAYFTSKEA